MMRRDPYPLDESLACKRVLTILSQPLNLQSCERIDRKGRRGNSPLNSQITLVTYEYHGHSISSSVIENLVTNDGAHFEGGSRGDRVDENPAVKSYSVTRGKDRELILST